MTQVLMILCLGVVALVAILLAIFAHIRLDQTNIQLRLIESTVKLQMKTYIPYPTCGHAGVFRGQKCDRCGQVAS